MLKKYKNSRIDVIVECGFSPTDFHAREDVEYGSDGEEIPIFHLIFQDTPLWFTVRNEVDNYHSFDCTFTKFALNFPQGPYLPEETYTLIDGIHYYLRSWLQDHVKEYLDDLLIPDLWGQIENEKPLVDGGKITDEEMLSFSDEEKLQLRLSIQEFKHLIVQTFAPNSDELEIIDNRLNYLCDGLDRLSRFDWRGIALSSLISISIALSLDTVKGKRLYDLFKQVFSTGLKFLQ